MRTFQYGSFSYKYELKKEKRSTLSLTVKPDMSIVVKCPEKTDDERIELFLRKKWLWLQKQLNFFQKFQGKKYVKEYVSGESFLYLGKQYQLIVKKAKEDKVVVQNGKLVFYTTKAVSNGGYTRIYINSWYKRSARKIFRERYAEVGKRFGYENMPKMHIKKMQKRWGSYTKKNGVILNPLLIYAHKECIDYVISHELCHVKHKNHDKSFYRLLELKSPRWKKVKEKLEMRFV